MKAYKLLKNMPGLNAGTVFVHDKYDRCRGSIACGCLKLAWDNGNPQKCDNKHRWNAGTHILPGQLIEDTKWFVKIKNERVERDGELKRRYTC